MFPISPRSTHHACPRCGSLDIEIPMWVTMNTRQIVSDYDEGCTYHVYCQTCSTHSDQYCVVSSATGTCETHSGASPCVWDPCNPLCHGWLHADQPRRILRCAPCERFPDDTAALRAHTVECGCDWVSIAPAPPHSALL
jgi:hypothetical protein